MKRLVVVLLICFPVLANGFPRELEEVMGKLYNQKSVALPKEEVFKKAITGYYNLVKRNLLSADQHIITIVDFSLSSCKKRLWVIDLKNSRVLFHNLVAHGKRTGEDRAQYFSNVVHSNMSSLGFYVTGDQYYGKHGLSLRLHGVDTGFNDNAFKRAIVMHGADYVGDDFIKKYGRLGRSFGCPAVSRKVYKAIIETIAKGSCMFIYYPDQNYFQKSVVLNDLSPAS